MLSSGFSPPEATEKKVSVVIPVYNRQTLVRRCLDDLVAQTMPHSDYEIIVVDDCSTDNTYDVLLEYQRAYPELFRLYKTESNSGGASVGRNIGIENAVGKYLCFIDSDEQSEPDLLENAYQLAIQKDSDLVFISYGYFSGKANKFLPSEVFPFGFNRADFDISQILTAPYYVDCYFKRELIMDANLRFNPQFNYGEDAIFLYTYIMRDEVKVFSLLADKVYIKVDYASDSPDSPHLVSNLIECDTLIARNREFCKAQTSDPKKRKLMDVFLRKALFRLIPRANNSLLPEDQQDDLHAPFDYRNMHPYLFSEMSKLVNEWVPPQFDKSLDPRPYLIMQAFRANDREALVQNLDWYDKMNAENAFARWSIANLPPPPHKVGKNA